MEQIKIIFFALASFFGVENGRIAADKTTVTIFPEESKIEIMQEGLFTIIESEKDSTLAVEQWYKISSWEDGNTNWLKELEQFPIKNFTLLSIENTIKPRLEFIYSKKENLQSFGIWYNEEKNQFSMNHIPKQNIKTNDGKLDGNYWVFNGNSTFSFTIEPFKEMSKNFYSFKKPIKELLPQLKNK